MRATDAPSVTDSGVRAGALRILVVNWQDRENPQAGGAEAHLHEIFGRLARRGHEVTLLVSGWRGAPRRARLDGMEVYRAGGRYTFSLAAPAAFRRHLVQRRFDVVVEDLNKVPLYTPLWTPGPVVLLVHHLFGATAFLEASPPVAAATWLLERGVPRVFRNAPTLAVSESTRQDLIARGLHARAIEVIPNGIDLDRFSPDPAVEKFPHPTLLYLGRLKRYKRVDLPIRAVARLREERLDVRFLVGGRGDHRRALEKLVSRLGLEDRVSFLGYVSEERKVELFRRAWVHVLTSPKEGWGIANLEAAACGTASVASDAPGLRESVVPGQTGFLVPHGDVERLAEALGTLLREPGVREGMSRRAAAFARGFSWDASAEAMEAYIRRVVALPGVG